MHQNPGISRGMARSQCLGLPGNPVPDRQRPIRRLVETGMQRQDIRDFGRGTDLCRHSGATPG